jgi:hypothetical protein
MCSMKSAVGRESKSGIADGWCSALRNSEALL